MSIESRSLATSLFKALDLLGLLNARTSGIGIAGIVEEMGLPRSSLLRMLDSLAHYGFVERDEARRYRVTSKFRDWRVEDGDERLKTRFRSLMRRIADEVGEMTVLGRLQGRRIRHISHEEPDCRVRVIPPEGRMFAIDRMAMGKLILSQRPDLVPNDCSEVSLAEIEKAGADGFAWNRGESEEGIIAWGTWLGEPSPLTPMLAVTWPDFRFSEDSLAKVKEILKNAKM
jgi:DNA-binding IclR family transcriptional regulator